MGETLRKAFRDPEAIEDVKISPNRAKAGYFYAFVTFRSAEDGTVFTTQHAKQSKTKIFLSIAIQSEYRNMPLAATTKFTSEKSEACPDSPSKTSSRSSEK